MADKQAAQASILSLDHDDNATYETMTLVISITPPPRDRELLEGKDLGDTFDVPLFGIENQSQMSFTQFWDESDTEHTKIDTIFGTKFVASWKITTPHGTPQTIDFDGVVVNITPAEIAVGGTYQRTVTVQRVTAITYA